MEGFFACDVRFRYLCLTHRNLNKLQLKSVKLIKDREGKPKGFGYIEFATLQDLKDGLAKSGVVSHCLRLQSVKLRYFKSKWRVELFVLAWQNLVRYFSGL